jgi:hypothetical protein
MEETWKDGKKLIDHSGPECEKREQDDPRQFPVSFVAPREEHKGD